jgi:hypothetical protein
LLTTKKLYLEQILNSDTSLIRNLYIIIIYSKLLIIM